MASVRPSRDINHVLKTRVYSDKKFFKILRWFLIVCEFFCAAPANIHFDLNKSLTEATTCLHRCCCNCNIFFCILHVIWCVIVMMNISVSTYYQTRFIDKNMPSIQKGLYMSEYISNNFNVILIMIGCYYHRAFYRKFLCRLIEIEQKLIIYKNYNEIRDELITKFLQLQLIVWVFFVIVLIIDLFFNDCNLKLFLRSAAVYTIPNIIMVLSLVQYWCLLYAIYLNFEKINHIMIGVTTIKSSTLFNSCHRKINTINFLSAEINYSTRAKRDDVQTILNGLRKIFSDLDILTGEITSTFGLVILTIFVGSFLILSIQIFALYKISELKNNRAGLILYTIFWIFLHTGKILLVLTVNNLLFKEKAKTGLILNEMDFQSAQSELSINRFLLQLMVRNRVQTACGVIELDLMFFGGIIAALSTYVIFLIQIDLGAVTLTSASPNGTDIKQYNYSRA